MHIYNAFKLHAFHVNNLWPSTTIYQFYFSKNMNFKFNSFPCVVMTLVS
jgi:hypothetical protein